MNIAENICPVCKYKNAFEAIVCRNCGAALEDPFIDPGAKTKTTDLQGAIPETIKEWSVAETTVPEGGIAIYVEGGFTPVYIDSTGEFVMGRKVGATSEGLLDLSPSGGYHLGVSRRHAVIRRTDQGYDVLDLGSANGTWLNDERLTPHQVYPLESGSHLRLGSMRLYVLYGHLSENKQQR